MFLFRKIIDFLFPLFCFGCETKGTLLCDICLKKIPLRSEQHCPICITKVTPLGKTCFECKNKSSLDGVFIASHYKDPLLSRSIHAFKYEFIPSLGNPLTKLLTESVTLSALPLPDIITYVPLHTWRLRWRGFNQSEILARELAEHILPGEKIPFQNTIIRTKFTRSQMKTQSKEERKENLESAFKLSREIPKNLLVGKRVWLIDDVITTGTTLEKCAEILKKSGAQEVHAITLAR